MGAAVEKSAQHTALTGEQERHIQKFKGLDMTLGDRGGAGERMPEAIAVELPLTFSNGG